MKAATRIGTLLALLFSMLLHSALRPGFIDAGLDPSWLATLQYAYINTLQFGRDIVWNFGPLGFLYGRIYDPDTYRTLVGGWLFFGIAAFVALKRLAPGPGRLLLLIAVSGLLPNNPDGFFFSLQAAAFFAASVGLHRDGRADTLPLALAAAIYAVTALIKFSFLATACCWTGALALSALGTRRYAVSVALPASAAALFCGLWRGASQPLAGLPAYLAQSWELSRAYSTSMTVARGVAAPLAYGAVAAAVALYLFRRVRPQGRALALTHAVASLAVAFLVGKASFTRSDDVHELIAASYVLSMGALCATLPGRVSPAISRAKLYASSAALAFAWLSLAQNQNYAFIRLFERAITRVIGTARAGLPQLCDAAALQARHEAAMAAIRRDYPLTGTFGATDVYPTLGVALIAHGIKYRPRPVIQSYSAFTPRLAALNAARLTSAQAPDDVIAALQAIDGRFPTLEDSMSLVGLKHAYRYVRGTALGAHLQRRDPPPPAPRKVLIQGFASNLGEPFAIPPSAKPLWVEIEATTSVLGRIAAAVWRWPACQLRAAVDAGDRQVTLKFTAPVEMLATGFLVAPRLLTSGDLEGWLAGDQAAFAAPIRSLEVRFEQPSYVSGSLKIRIYRYEGL